MIVVSITSWIKRIENVKNVIESVMDNTIKPDRVYLNLSKTEFEGIELPKDLVDYFNSDDRLIINWVDGENTKSMKKVFPILQYLNDDDIIINLDDDALLPNTFIESRCNDFKIKKSPITSCNNPKYHYIDKELNIWSCGPGSLFQKKMLKGYEKIIDNTLIHTYNDDWCYSTLLWLNGYRFTPCSSYFMQNGAIDYNGTKLKKYNAVEPMGKNHVYVGGVSMHNMLEKRIIDLFGVGFKDSFGILKNNNVVEKLNVNNIETLKIKEMIVVSLTSWVKRIGYVKKVVESIMNNTIKPDRVYLNLSKTEFEGIDLPKDLVDYFNSDDRLIINWVDGENTKSMKKVFPILQYLNDDDIIILADDDILFPIDLIESRINDFNKFGKKYSISSTSSTNSIGTLSNMYIASAVSLYTKRMLKNWEKYVNIDIVRTYNDDRTYLYILWLNGFLNRPCGRYNVVELLESYSLNLDENGLSKNKQVIRARKYDEIAKERLKKISNNNIKDMFGFFSNTVRHDCVMVYCKNGVDSKEMSCAEHFEIEYVIASLKKYCSSWVGRIFIVGSEPPKNLKNDVIHIACDDPYTHCKDSNIIHKLRFACENIPDLSDDFLMLSDDQVVTKKSSWEDMKPRFVRKYSDWTDEKWEKNRKLDFWHECLYKTLKSFPSDKSCFWEPHIWSPMNKYKFIEMCNKYNYQNDICIVLSLYYNFIEEMPIKDFDHLYINSNKQKEYINSLSLNNIPRHLSWTDIAFSDKKFRNILDTIVGFDKNIDNKDKKDNKVSNSYNKSVILTIREDLKNGNLVKINKPDGTFIWKRIKK